MRKNVFIILLALIMCVPLFTACSNVSDEQSEEPLPFYYISAEKKEKLRLDYFGGAYLVQPEDSDRPFRFDFYYIGKFEDYEGILVTEKFQVDESYGSFGFGDVRGVYFYADGQFYEASTKTVLKSAKQRQAFCKAYYAVLAELCANQRVPD